jgi:hypothetical protein
MAPMKFKPTSPSNSAREKIQYEVVIEDSTFITAAFTPESALSNAAFRFAEETDEDVALVKWQIKNDKLYFNVEEV